MQGLDVFDILGLTLASNDDKKGSRFCRIPKLIDNMLGSPDNIRFIIKGKNIFVTKGE